MNNETLKDVYDTMHRKGVTSWFSDGHEERELILKMGEPWGDLTVLEIGCGEGDLANEIFKTGGKVYAIDYSTEAFSKTVKHSGPVFGCGDYRNLVGRRWGRIVMQGVLEHLDNPFTELKWMIDNLLVRGGDIITSSPCFLNPRGIVWHTLRMVGAVMSKTDIHFLDPDQFEDFCRQHRYKLDLRDCDVSWGNREDMIKDLRQRIPLALRDGNIHYIPEDLDHFLDWLSKYKCDCFGANVAYRIQT